MKKIPRVPSSSFLFLLSPFDEGRTTQVELYALIDPAVNTLRSVILPIVKLVVIRVSFKFSLILFFDMASVTFYLSILVYALGCVALVYIF